jgi:hypothetical protein
VTVGGLCNLASANYTDIKLIDAITGQVLTRGLDTACVMSGGDTNRALVYTDYWTVGAGQTRTVKLTADIGKFTPATGETIKATLAEFRDGDIKNMNTTLYLQLKLCHQVILRVQLTTCT